MPSLPLALAHRQMLFGLGLLLLFSAQTPPPSAPTPESSPSSTSAPISVPMPISTTRIQVNGLPPECSLLSLHIDQSDPLAPGSQTLLRAAALQSGGRYSAEFVIGPGISPGFYAPGQISLRCSGQSDTLRLARPLALNQAELLLNWPTDFVPGSPATKAPLPPLSAAMAERRAQAESELQSRSALCRQPAFPRFFADQGEDYTLNLNGGPPVTIIGRKSWGAGPPITAGRSWQPYPAGASVCSWYRRITVHHTHTPLSIQGLQKYHQTQADPKADIAYHFYIPASGEIYEARPLGYMGSHSESDNGQNLGIVLNGDFTHSAPTAAQLSALRQLLAALRCPCGFSEGLWTHQQRKHLRFQGARSTSCPGEVLAQEVYGLATQLGFGPLTPLP